MHIDVSTAAERLSISLSRPLQSGGLGGEVDRETALLLAQDIAVLLHQHEHDDALLTKGQHKALAKVFSSLLKFQSSLGNKFAHDLFAELWESAPIKFPVGVFLQIIDIQGMAVRERLQAPLKPEALNETLCGNLARIPVERLGVRASVSTTGPEAPTVAFVKCAFEAFAYPLQFETNTIVRYIQRERSLREE